MSEIGEHTEYELDALTEDQLESDPFVQFYKWLELALHTDGLKEPNAMTVATVGSNGAPSARVVLLRNVDERGLTFFTNYDSRKGQEMRQNPQVAAVFFWPELQRSIRVEGTVSKIDDAESDAYFAGRPIRSQMGAVVSHQSEVLPNRQVLEDALKALEAEHANGKPVARPANWGGDRIEPHYFEFWQGRRSRLHDRLVYQKTNETWQITRLAP